MGSGDNSNSIVSKQGVGGGMLERGRNVFIYLEI